MATDTAPVLTAKASESVVASEPAVVEEDTVVAVQPIEEPKDDEFYQNLLSCLIKVKKPLGAFACVKTTASPHKAPTLVPPM